MDFCQGSKLQPKCTKIDLCAEENNPQRSRGEESKIGLVRKGCKRVSESFRNAAWRDAASLMSEYDGGLLTK